MIGKFQVKLDNEMKSRLLKCLTMTEQLIGRVPESEELFLMAIRALEAALSMGIESFLPGVKVEKPKPVLADTHNVGEDIVVHSLVDHERADHLWGFVQRNFSDRVTISRRDLHHVAKGTFRKPNDLNRPIQVLVEHGYLRPAKSNGRKGRKGRKPSPRFSINHAAIKYDSVKVD
jgi:hypothetical protein